MKILVTGGAGFIGSNFIRYALTRFPDAQLVNFDKLTYAGNLDNLRDIAASPRYTFIQGDIADAAAVASAMRGCEAVINFAAESHVDRSITDATPFIQTNYLGVAVLLEAARQEGVRRFVQVGTDEAYGDISEGVATEEDPLWPNSPYAASKAAADLLARSYCITHHVPVMITRASNNYGPYQYPEKIIPLFATNVLEGLPLPLYGDGLQVRDWLYVLDHCDALCFLLERGASGEIYNISGNYTVSNRELALHIIHALDVPRPSAEGRDVGEDRLMTVPDRPGHDRRYALDGGKLARLGWQPRMSFAQALHDTLAWYRGHAGWWQPLKERLRADPYHWLNRPARPGAVQPAGPALWAAKGGAGQRA